MAGCPESIPLPVSELMLGFVELQLGEVTIGLSSLPL